MIKKILFFIGATILVVVVVVFAKNTYEVTTSVETVTNSPEEKFVPPIYGSDGSEIFVTLPLTFESISSRGFTLSEKQRINDFKKLILSRVMSKIPLRESEKSIIAISISTTTKPAVGGLTLADQNIFKFTADEVSLISKILKDD